MRKTKKPKHNTTLNIVHTKKKIMVSIKNCSLNDFFGELKMLLICYRCEQTLLEPLFLEL